MLPDALLPCSPGGRGNMQGAFSTTPASTQTSGWKQGRDSFQCLSGARKGKISVGSRG